MQKILAKHSTIEYLISQIQMISSQLNTENTFFSSVLSQRKYTNRQEAHEEMFHVTVHQENISQNHNKVPLNAHYERNQKLLCIAYGNLKNTSTVENNFTLPQKVKPKITRSGKSKQVLGKTSMWTLITTMFITTKRQPQPISINRRLSNQNRGTAVQWNTIHP